MNVTWQAALRYVIKARIKANIASTWLQHGAIVSLNETRHLDALCHRDPAPVISTIYSPSAI